MSTIDVERELHALADTVEWAATPDIAGRLSAQIAPVVPRRRRRVGWRLSWVHVALAAVLTLAVVVAAVPPVRAALERALGIAARERIERVDQVPRAPRLDLGRAVTLAEARRVSGRAIAIPRSLGAPDGIRLGGELPGGTVALLYGTDTILTEIPSGGVFALKALGPGARVTQVRVGNARGYWIASGPRALVLLGAEGRPRRVRSALPGSGVLLWDRRGVALRLETRRSLSAALEIAESIP